MDFLKFLESSPSYRDKEGNVIDLMKFADLWEDLSYRIIKKDIIGNYHISTIWLGVIYFPNFLFETMVFIGNDCLKPDFGNEDFIQRYTTLEEAIKGHEEIVKEYEEKLNRDLNG